MLVPQASYNRARGLQSLLEISESQPAGNQSDENVRTIHRLEHLEDWRLIRSIYSQVGGDIRLPKAYGSRAICNLANVLDESGRWLEAYSEYSTALVLDPTNGNAAGNMAELLRRRLLRNSDQKGHIATVYNHFVRIAQSLRDRTVEIAGIEAANRWDSMKLIISDGHFSHQGDQFSDYQKWIVFNRLVLVAAVEGLGSDGQRWDTASISGAVNTNDNQTIPSIFASMNVLKADYLVARRLAFNGQQMIKESGGMQHVDDPGLYTDTLDDSIYGEASSLLVLAQRSALDVLDKIAVTANEFFGFGFISSKVNFISFWKNVMDMDSTSQGLRFRVKERAKLLPFLELSIDLSKTGIYSMAMQLRNAGTHRLVRATHGPTTSQTSSALNSLNIDELVESTIQALSVTRAFYLYFTDLISGDLPEVDDNSSSIFPLMPQI